MRLFGPSAGSAVSSACCFGCGLLLVAGAGMDGPLVRLVIGAAFGDRGDVVDFGGSGLAADVADASVAFQDAPVVGLALPAGLAGAV